MTITRACAACLIAFTAPALANDYDEIPQTPLKDTQLVSVSESPEPKLRAAAIANPNLEWHDGEDGEADSMVMLSDVLFEFGTSRLSPKAIDTLSVISAELPGIEALEIVGHTDSIGTEAANKRLAEARAQAVKVWLVANSPIYPDVLSVVGMGEDQPVAENRLENGADNPEGRALNRRVEFHLPKPAAQDPQPAS